MFGQMNVLVWLPQQTLQAQQHALDIVDSTPFVLQDIQAYPPTEIDVWVEDRGLEQNRRWSVRIRRWKLKGELEGKGSVGCIRRAGDRGSPVEEIFWRRGKC